MSTHIDDLKSNQTKQGLGTGNAAFWCDETHPLGT